MTAERRELRELMRAEGADLGRQLASNFIDTYCHDNVLIHPDLPDRAPTHISLRSPPWRVRLP